MMETLVNVSSFKGFNVSPAKVNAQDFNIIEADASPATETLVAARRVTADEFIRPGQGEDEGQEYTRGRIYADIQDGSGTQLPDQSDVELVKLSSQNRVNGVVRSFTYEDINVGASNPKDREMFPEVGNEILAKDEKLGLRVQTSGGSAFTVDLSKSTFKIDVVRGEK